MRQMTLGEMKTPCNRFCDVEWGSLRCMERNGYMYDYRKRKWLRNDDGNIIVGKGTCDYVANDMGRTSG